MHNRLQTGSRGPELLHFGVGFQSPQIKQAPDSPVADRGASTGPRQHLSEQ